MPTPTRTEATIKEVQQEADKLVEQDVDSTDSNVRYAGYAARVRTAFRAAHRYFAYSSDVGEAFRPVVHPRIVQAAYGISWIYVLGDVGYETYKSKKQGPTIEEAKHFSEPTRLALVAAKRGIFQGVASMALPAFTIHSIVRYSARGFTKASNPRIKAWGPTVTGLAMVPFLPYMFDEPVEHVTDVAFEWIEKQIGKAEDAASSSGKKDL
ncbi:mitochondrial 18 KDa protein-domain-containing protein [Auriculariales sp. MPI-PUGE-AT-0066]|nr:mitochondrial 18 KDa protein-domain-containing protein [Auriculariales sp. MPI-PUGE-AT-0066]